jgi:hypothetical protein
MNYLSGMLDDDTKDRRYHPRSFEELAADPIPQTFINEPLPPDNVSTLAVARVRSIHATLVESLNSTRALQHRLELGVTVPRDRQREVVRAPYAATRNQVQALAACLELEGLE